MTVGELLDQVEERMRLGEITRDDDLIVRLDRGEDPDYWTLLVDINKVNGSTVALEMDSDEFPWHSY